MKVVIAGGTGLIGRALTAKLVADGQEVVILSRTAGAAADPRVTRVGWTPDGTSGPWAAELDSADAIVNLTGAGIADQRWTPARKAALLSSRTLPTRSLIAAIQQRSQRPPVFVQGGAVGAYGTARGAQPVDETCAPGNDFAARLCEQWEAAAEPVRGLGCRLVQLRAGVVLSSAGGILARLKLPFLLGGGGPISSGRQYLSWIHEGDLVAMIAWALATPLVQGVVNATSPEPVTNTRFSAALGRALHRPTIMRVPAFALRIVYGEMAQVMLVEGQRVVPRRALDLGFRFAHPVIEEAMVDVLSPRRP